MNSTTSSKANETNNSHPDLSPRGIESARILIGDLSVLWAELLDPKGVWELSLWLECIPRFTEGRFRLWLESYPFHTRYYKTSFGKTTPGLPSNVIEIYRQVREWKGDNREDLREKLNSLIIILTDWVAQEEAKP
jgi:hypothetical protein